MCHYPRPTHSWFSYRLGLAEHNELPSRLHAEAIVRDTAFKVETHTAQTKDGFVLVLHRLVPRNAKQVRTFVTFNPLSHTRGQSNINACFL
jgi:hypothetical protein